MPSICAIVVTHYPDEELAENLAALRAAVRQVVVVDNGSGEQTCRRLETLRGPGVEMILNRENLGLAAAINQGIAWAQAREFAWIATFDQDSRIPADYFTLLLEAWNTCPERERVAVVSARIHDARLGRTHSFARVACRDGETAAFVPFAITSGSLISSAAITAEGPYREDFFIDGVDVEFCLRCRRRGWRILEAQQAVLEHRFGEPVRHRFLWMRPAVTPYSALRRYYAMRNRVVLYRAYGMFDPGWLWGDLRETLRNMAKLVLFEQDRAAKLTATARGCWHGLIGRMGPMRE